MLPIFDVLPNSLSQCPSCRESSYRAYEFASLKSKFRRDLVLSSEADYAFQVTVHSPCEPRQVVLAESPFSVFRVHALLVEGNRIAAGREVQFRR